MTRLTISSFIKILIPKLNEENNQEKAFHLLFDPICKEIGYVELSSKKISQIMNEKEDIQESIRQAVNEPEIIDEIRENFKEKVIPILRRSLIDDLLYEYSQLINGDTDISPRKKEKFQKVICSIDDDEDTANFLSVLFIYVVNIPFKKHDEFSTIHYCSKTVKDHEENEILSAIVQQYGAYVDLDKGSSRKVLKTHLLYKLTVECILDEKYVRRNFFITLEFEYDGAKYMATTSCDNWYSQSKMNNLLSAGISTMTLLFEVESIEKGTVHIFLIGELYK